MRYRLARRFGRWRQPQQRESRTAGIEPGVVDMDQRGVVVGDNAWFWHIERPWRFSPEFCQMMIEQIMEAMSKALSSGVVEYRVGSRSLKRFTIKELQDLLGFWMLQLDDIMGPGRARRAAPTDT